MPKNNSSQVFLMEQIKFNKLQKSKYVSSSIIVFQNNLMTKVCIISGGSGGLGFALASKLLKEGRNIVILGRNSEKLIQAAEWLQTGLDYYRVTPVVCNIGDEKDIRKLGDFLNSQEMTVEYLFNNAGRGLFAKADSSTSAMVDDVFEANLKGMILLTSEILRITPVSEELTIVNIMSTSSLYGRVEETIYCAAKWGARGYTEALRTELKGTKRNIIAVYPGGMKTDFWKVPGQKRDISTFMEPSEVAEKIVNAVFVSDNMLITDITINRKR
jgi:short-subunit dehydrogenase